MMFRIYIRHGATLVWKEPHLVAGPTILGRADDLIREYADHSGRSLDVMPWFEVMAGIQLAVLLEGTYLRALEGKALRTLGDEIHRTAGQLVVSSGPRNE